MEQDIVLEKLHEKIVRAASLKSLPRFSPEFKKWHRESSVLLERAFGRTARQVNDFAAVNYNFYGSRSFGDMSPTDNSFFHGLEDAVAILTSIKEEVLEFGLDPNEPFGPFLSNPIAIIESLCTYFHSVARQLRNRHAGRPTIDITDEYDVQDLLYALLRIQFRDIRPEEWSPSYAGNSSRMDFLLKPEKLVIEVKMTRKSLSDKDLVDQLIVDRTRYESHPFCESMVCFVYDPEGRISNPSAITSDLEQTPSTLPVRVFIFPKIE